LVLRFLGDGRPGCPLAKVGYTRRDGHWVGNVFAARGGMGLGSGFDRA